ncbi:MAG: hypothetical protein K8R11_13015 [Methanococcoides sp.]|nr:hypothetical protein [Methanococcoides sp.]
MVNDDVEVKPVNTRQLLHGVYKGIHYQKKSERSPHYLEFSDCTQMNICVPVIHYILTREMVDDFIERCIIQDYPTQVHSIVNGDFELDVKDEKLVVKKRLKTISPTRHRVY